MLDENKKVIYESLQKKYNITIGKKELSEILDVSQSYIDKAIMRGDGIPNYKKLGSSKNAKVVFNLLDIADYITNTTKVYY